LRKRYEILNRSMRSLEPHDSDNWLRTVHGH
jgi:hypothetical protein